jgi:hypothetical protein
MDHSGRTQLSFRIDCPVEWESEGIGSSPRMLIG